MRRFRHQPIRRKLLLIILATAAASLILFLIGISLYESATYRSGLARQLSGDATFIAANSAPPLAFRDKETAREILTTLEALSEIVVAALYTPEGEIFASFVRPGQPVVAPPPAPGAEGLRFTDGYLIIVQPVEQKGIRLGVLYLQADLAAHMREELKRYGSIILVVGLTAIGGAFLLLRLLQQMVSEPLLRLAKTAERIAAGDHRARVPVDSDDEIGQLARSFNHMTLQLANSLERLEESRARLAGIIGGSTDLIAALDRDFRFIAFNPAYQEAFAKIFKIRIKEGMSLIEALAHRPEEQSWLVKTWGRALNGEEFIIDREFGSGDLERRHVEMIYSSIRNQDGQLIGASHIARDITRRKQVENERKRLIEDLARSNRELEQFAYVASHDLQEPLRMVASYLQLLERKYRSQLDDKAIRYMDFAVEGALRMQKLIEGLLAYSRISRRGAEFKRIDVNHIFAQTVANLTAAINDTGAVVTRDDLPVITGDETQLLQLFQNLIGNAVKYRRPAVPPAVHVSVQRQEREWVFGIHDNGIGIASPYYERIFLIFQRLHTRGEYPGTGIGLALCKRIVESHHGRIWVESTPGSGTTFFFTIPAERNQQ
jgi:PAS domain S-box-containing protein